MEYSVTILLQLLKGLGTNQTVWCFQRVVLFPENTCTILGKLTSRQLLSRRFLESRSTHKLHASLAVAKVQAEALKNAKAKRDTPWALSFHGKVQKPHNIA